MSDRVPSFSAASDREIFDGLRLKWREVPAAEGRYHTDRLAELSTDDLVTTWRHLRETAVSGPSFPVRGWYHTLYRDIFRGRKILDVGCGLGIDTITYAESGADVTFLDVVPGNLELVRRLCGAMGIRPGGLVLLEQFEDLSRLPGPFDVIYAQGSLINAPVRHVRAEAQGLLQHLPIGGRWVELAYPKERWERDGRPAFSDWGVMTDGPGTPWVEWYDLEKLTDVLRPARFETILAMNFHNNDFNWFDLRRVA